MFAWLSGPGESFRHPLPNSTNYLSAYDKRGRLLRQPDPLSGGGRNSGSRSDEKRAAETREDLRPFPLNGEFVSQSILSETLRQEIWKRVQVDKKSVRTVSVELGVEMRRVGAVVRLVEVERRMKAEGRLVALPYAKAVHSMVPITEYEPGNVRPHESINDLPVHPLTNQQIFYPTSESRAFNRVDAGRVFSGAPRLPDEQDVGQGAEPSVQSWQDTSVELTGKKGNEIQVLKSADARIPHPHLIAFAKDRLDPSFRGNQDEVKRRYAQRLIDDATLREEKRAQKAAREEASKRRIETDRWQFIVKEVKATRQNTGTDGRGTGAPGFRYGVPSQDRKRGQVKIPTKVEV